MMSFFKSADRLPNSDLVSDCRLMLRFARKDGTDLPPELEQQIARLDADLGGLGLEPITDIPEVLVSKIRSENQPSAESPPAGASKFSTESILSVHAALSRVIAPATALSLQTTEPPPGGNTFFGGMPLVVKSAALASLVCAAGFVVSAAVIGSKAAKARPPAATAAPKADAAKDAARKADAAKVEENKKADSDVESAKATEDRKAEEKAKRASGEGEKK